VSQGAIDAGSAASRAGRRRATPGELRRWGLADDRSERERRLRYHATALFFAVVLRCYVRLRVRGLERLPSGPYVLCFNHLSWLDPFVLLAVWPSEPRLFIYGPKEADMTVGLRNRLIAWSGMAVPFDPEKTHLLASLKRGVEVLKAGHPLAIAGEGGLSDHEEVVLPLHEGTAWFALKAGVPVVPVAISGTRWWHFGKRIHVTVGDPIDPGSRRPDAASVQALTAQAHAALSALVAGQQDGPVPGRFGRWLTGLFDERDHG
jgi:1-acyl-sn-glycerol-3-phosphate acyltransferase